MEVVRKVVSAHDSELTLQDNSTILADAFIFCTGYLLDYPFLDKRSGILVEKNRLRPLFRDALNVNHLSMIFVGLPIVTYYGSLYYDQVGDETKKNDSNEGKKFEFNFLFRYFRYNGF